MRVTATLPAIDTKRTRLDPWHKPVSGAGAASGGAASVACGGSVSRVALRRTTPVVPRDSRVFLVLAAARLRAATQNNQAESAAQSWL